jgi:hypothetical protein
MRNSLGNAWIWRAILPLSMVLPLPVATFGQQPQTVTLKGRTYTLGGPFDYSSQPGYDPATGTATSIQATNNIVTSNSGPNGLSGFNVNNFLGANTFYTAGFTGTQAIMANIEAGHVAGAGVGLGGAVSPGYTGGHDTLEHVTTYFRSNANPQSDLQMVDRHATWVGHAMGGRTNTANYGNPPVADQAALMRGIGFGATMWSGGIASAWTGAAYRLNFTTTFATYIDPYREAIINDQNVTSVNLPSRANVVNSSWGFVDPTGSAFGDFSRGVDGLTRNSGANGQAVAVVFSAGNRGEFGTNTVGGPASGYNVISVGALGSDTSSPLYNTISTFSSRGPMQVFVPSIPNVTDINNPAQGQIIDEARGRVDISAPGQNLTLAYYGGTTGGNQAPSQGGTPNGGEDFYSFNTQGTSFAAPQVAGGLALLFDAGTTQLGGANNALDARVLKSVLLNSADKTAGWTNNHTGTGTTVDPYETTRGLDYDVGAGRMNLDKAFNQYLNGTTGLPGTGGNVAHIGWDFGFVDENSPTADYYIVDTLQGGSLFTATLSWFVNRSIDNTNTTLEQRFDDLDLEIYRVGTVGGPILAGNLVATSNTTFDIVEHVHFTLPEDGFYAIRVNWFGTNWNFTGTTGESFGLAWAGVRASAVPEPGTIALCMVAGAVYYIKRRRKAATLVES